MAQAANIRADIRKKLDSLIEDMNTAATMGVRIEFNLAADPQGKWSIQRFDCWAKMPDEGTSRQ